MHATRRWGLAGCPAGALTVFAITPAGFGHHSSAEYDRSRLVELEGDAGERLDHALTVTDPETFAGAFTREGHWMWCPGEVVGRYACTAE